MHDLGLRHLLLLAIVPLLCGGVILEPGTTIEPGILADTNGAGTAPDTQPPIISSCSCSATSETTAAPVP